MSKTERVLAAACAVLLLAAVSSVVVADDGPVIWYSAETDEGPCQSCFEMEFVAAVLAPTLRLAPAASGKSKKPPYIPPTWLAGKPNAATWGTTGGLGLVWAALWVDGNNSDDAETIKEVGDYTQIITPLAGLGMAAGAKDKKGLIQYGISFGVSMATVQVFKNTANRWRPDGTDQHSFPSGHAAGSFFAAGFI
jgi:membrane-associated phospholipid phosphatase